METLLADVEAFLARNREVSATAFGDTALGDRHFVRQLRAGRRVWPETEDKVRRFMSSYSVAPPPPFPNPTRGTDQRHPAEARS